MSAGWRPATNEWVILVSRNSDLWREKPKKTLGKLIGQVVVKPQVQHMTHHRRRRARDLLVHMHLQVGQRVWLVERLHCLMHYPGILEQNCQQASVEWGRQCGALGPDAWPRASVILGAFSCLLISCLPLWGKQPAHEVGQAWWWRLTEMKTSGGGGLWSDSTPAVHSSMFCGKALRVPAERRDWAVIRHHWLCLKYRAHCPLLETSSCYPAAVGFPSRGSIYAREHKDSRSLFRLNRCLFSG